MTDCLIDGLRAAHRRAHAAFLEHVRACSGCADGALCPSGRLLNEEADDLGRQLDLAVVDQRAARRIVRIAA